MKLLVTGGCGFIGSHFIEAAISAGHQVLNLDKLTYAANPASLAHLAEHPSYELRHVDVSDPQPVDQAFADFHPGAVVHLAAETHVDRSIDDPTPFLDSNVSGTYQLLRAATRHWNSLTSTDAQGIRASFRVLHVSTDEVYGTLGKSGSFHEDSPYQPRSPYAASKAAADHLVRAWHATYGLPVVIAHPTNTYGPRQYPEKLIPLAILRSLHGQAIPVYGDGSQVRDWLYVQDLVAALLTLITAGKTGDSYNIGGENRWTNLELLTELCKRLDQMCPRARPYREGMQFVADRPGHDFRYTLDASKLRDQTGWQAKYLMDQGLQETVEWYLSHPAWWEPLVERGDVMKRRGLIE